jgi:hypothetical protein
MIAGEHTARRASKVSRKVLQPIIDHLLTIGEKFYFDETEYGLRNVHGHFFYDLVVPRMTLCVEYQSACYHPNPFWSQDKWNSWSNIFDASIQAIDKLEYDLNKAKHLWTDRGFRTWFVWEDTCLQDVEVIMHYLETTNEEQYTI